MNRISHFRKQVGLSQYQAAIDAGWEYQSRWSSYERGVRAIDIQTGRLIVQVLRRAGARNDEGSLVTLDDVFPADPAARSAAA